MYVGVCYVCIFLFIFFKRTKNELVRRKRVDY